MKYIKSLIAGISCSLILSCSCQDCENQSIQTGYQNNLDSVVIIQKNKEDSSIDFSIDSNENVLVSNHLSGGGSCDISKQELSDELCGLLDSSSIKIKFSDGKILEYFNDGIYEEQGSIYNLDNYLKENSISTYIINEKLHELAK